MKEQKATRFFTSLTGVLIVLGIIIAVNIAVGAIPFRKDLTEDGIYTLTPGTKKLLQGLNRDVTLKFYFSRSNGAAPIFLKQYAQRISDLLHEYELNGGGRIAVETYDPRPDSDEEEWAQRYGLTPQSLGTIGPGSGFYFGLVAVAGPQEAAIPFLSPGAEPQLEYLITQLIYKTTQKSQPKIGVMSSLPVMGLPFRRAREPGAQGWLAIEELKKQYEVVEVSFSAEEIPADIDTLVVIHPKNLSDPTAFALDQFVLRGGRLLAFVDPLCLAEREVMPNPQPLAFVDNASDLNRITKAWGLELAAGKVVADLKNASIVTSSSGSSERMPAWLSLHQQDINRQEVVTGALENLMLPFAGAIEGSPAADLAMTTLAHTSDSTSLIGTFEAMQPGPEKMRGAERSGRTPLAVRLQGMFPTAFPDGYTREVDGKSEKKTGLAKSSQPGVVVLVSDVDILYDRFCARGMNLLGQTFFTPINDNLNFFLNLVEELSGSSVLIGLRSRGTYGRPFEKVIALEEQAQQRWQQEELKLLANLRETQERINQLQKSKGQDQKYILSPEEKKEIEEFRQQRFETQRQLKLVRKNLRSDIERLGLTLKVLNLGLIPLLVVLYGLYHGWRRRKQAGAA